MGYPEWYRKKDRVVANILVVSVESTGMHESDELFLQSVAILKEKARRLRAKLSSIE